MFYYYQLNSYVVDPITHSSYHARTSIHSDDVDQAQDVVDILETYLSGSPGHLNLALQCIDDLVGYDAFLDYDDEDIMDFLHEHGFIDLDR